jgi:GAF domain-containing protein
MGRGSAKDRAPRKSKPRAAKAPAKRSPSRAARTARARSSAKADPKSEAARLSSELNGALQRQAAMADILKVIAGSRVGVQPVFDQILDSIEHLIGGDERVIILAGDDGLLRLGAAHSPRNEALRKLFPIPLDGSASGLAIRERRLIAYADVLNDPAAPAAIKAIARRTGAISVAIAPLLTEDRAIGTIIVTRSSPEPFSENERALLGTFADQAVIAIENARLFNETREALERQTATADILKVIASSPSDVQPVFEAIAERANQLVGGHAATVLRISGDMVVLAAYTPVNAESDAVLRATFPIPIKGNQPFEMVQRGEMSEIGDTELYAHLPIRNLGRARGFRSRVLVPLKSDSGVIGAISVTRVSPGTFAEHHVQLLQTFADQAVIAIQNATLFNELQARTRDLTESLEQQTATGEILSSISGSMHDTRPVFEAIVRNLLRLFGTRFAVVQTLNDGIIDMPAADGEAGFERLTERYPRPLAADTVGGLAMLERRTIQFQPVLGNPAAPEGTRGFARDFGFDSVLFTPMLSGDKVVGAIGVAQHEPKPFDDKQIALISSFAHQAAIAIENTRLLKELRERTDDLGESLQQQTATSEVLRAISSASGDLQPVFKVMLDNALKICEAPYGNLMLLYADGFEAAELHNSPPALAELFKRGRLVPSPGTALGRCAATKEVVHVPDILAESGGAEQSPLRVVTVENMRARTLLAVPMLRESELVGVIIIYRQEVRPFSEKQIELVANFADQAVIAIENARLLNELRKRTEELSQSLEDLRAAQDRLIQTEKLASLGQLTAGIAHEIKNPLNFVNNFSALSAELTDELNDVLKSAVLTDKMREEVGELTKLLKDNLEKVVQHGKRADSIVKNMLLHSREGAGEQRNADVNALVEESLNLAYHGARAERPGFNVTLQRDFDAGAGVAELFPQEITRALLNLISNGFYAAIRRSGEAGFEPTLRASTRNLGSRVEIRIRDNGTGIPPEVKEKMFNPFFTTKPAGEGTGLGLSMTHDIVVKQHGGRIDVETRPGEFTEFIIVLPRAGSPQPSAPGQSTRG